MSLKDLFVFLLFDGAYKEIYSYIRVTEMFPQISLSITNPKKMFIKLANKGKGFSILSHIYAYLHLGLECEKKKENYVYIIYSVTHVLK